MSTKGKKIEDKEMKDKKEKKREKEEGEIEEEEEEEEDEEEEEEEEEEEFDDDGGYNSDGCNDDDNGDDDNHMDDRCYNFSDNNDRANVDDVLETLLMIQKYKQKKEKERKKKFLPTIGDFLKSTFPKRSKLISDSLVRKFVFLSKNIVNKKIPINIGDTEMRLLKKISKRKISQDDLKILLVEDVRLSLCFKDAFKLLSLHKK